MMSAQALPVGASPWRRLSMLYRLPAQLALAPLAWLLAGVDAVVRRPSLAVAGTVLLVCLPPGAQNLTSTGSVTVTDAAAGVVVAAVAIGIVRGARVRRPYGLLPFAAVSVALAVATITALDVGESVEGFARYAEHFVLLPVAVAMSVRDRRDALLVAGSVAVTTLVEGVVGVVQALTGTGASYAGQYVRAVGTFGAEQIQALGALLGYGLVVMLALALGLRGRPRIALLAAAGFVVLPLALSLSRGAWIATAAALLVVLAVFSWRLTVATVAVTAFAVAALAVGGAAVFDERLTSIVSSGSAPDRSVQDRYALWGTAVDIWADHPVTGVGLKDFAQVRDSYAPMSLSAGSDVDDPAAGFRREPLLSPHNQYLLVLSEQGLLGALAFGALLAALAVSALRRRRDPAERSTVDARLLDLAAPGIVVWTLVNFVYGDVGGGPVGVVLAILLGLAARRRLLVPRPIDAPAAGARPAVTS